MTSKKLKLMAGNRIMKSDYSKSAKKQLLNFVLNEADKSQLKALILDGNVEKLDEDADNIINKRFDIVIEKELKDFICFAKENLCNIIEEQNHNLKMHEKMINFIVNEASDYQVLSMFFEGNLPDETSNPKKEISLNEKAYNIIEGALFINEVGTLGKIVGGIALTAAAVVGTAVYGAHKLYQRYITQAGRACRGATNPRACRKRYKINGVKIQINALKASMAKCDKTKDPEKCKKKLAKEIAKLDARLAGVE
jgi:hypothetical protein